jgi:hypothetical protein
VRHHRRVADELQQRLAYLRLGETRLVGEEGQRQAVDTLGLGVDLALRMNVAMKGAAGGQEVFQFDAGDLHHPVAHARIEARGFSVENDFARHPGS